MMNNIERFVNYFDGDLSNAERNAFLELLNKNADFKKEFQKFEHIYFSLKKNIGTDERYFSTIIVNAKKKFEKEKSNFIVKYASASAIICILIIISISIFSSNITEEQNYRNLLDSFIEDEIYTFNLFVDPLQIEKFYMVDNEIFIEYFNKGVSIDETLFDYLEANLNSDEINDNVINKLSIHEFNSIYDKLLNKKFYR